MVVPPADAGDNQEAGQEPQPQRACGGTQGKEGTRRQHHRHDGDPTAAGRRDTVTAPFAGLIQQIAAQRIVTRPPCRHSGGRGQQPQPDECMRHQTTA